MVDSYGKGMEIYHTWMVWALGGSVEPTQNLKNMNVSQIGSFPQLLLG